MQQIYQEKLILPQRHANYSVDSFLQKQLQNDSLYLKSSDQRKLSFGQPSRERQQTTSLQSKNSLLKDLRLQESLKSKGRRIDNEDNLSQRNLGEYQYLQELFLKDLSLKSEQEQADLLQTIKKMSEEE